MQAPIQTETVVECNQCFGVVNDRRCMRRTCKYARYCWQHAKSLQGIQIKKSGIPGSGLGLFAARNFKAKENVVRYTGDEHLIANIPDYATTEFPYGVEARPFLINAVSTQSNNGRYSNMCRAKDIKEKRCKKNNASLVTSYIGQGQPIVQLKTTEPIPSGKEILTSYGHNYFNNKRNKK